MKKFNRILLWSFFVLLSLGIVIAGGLIVSDRDRFIDEKATSISSDYSDIVSNISDFSYTRSEDNFSCVYHLNFHGEVVDYSMGCYEINNETIDRLMNYLNQLEEQRVGNLNKMGIVVNDSVINEPLLILNSSKQKLLIPKEVIIG